MKTVYVVCQADNSIIGVFESKDTANQVAFNAESHMFNSTSLHIDPFLNNEGLFDGIMVGVTEREMEKVYS